MDDGPGIQSKLREGALWCLDNGAWPLLVRPRVGTLAEGFP